MHFDTAVTPGGYAWWYIDALSDDGEHGVVVIAFIGSVFSPYYAAARRRHAATDPSRYCAINAVLYEPGAAQRGRRHRWAMTERGAAHVARTRHSIVIGPSSLAWEDTTLVIRIDEIANPLPRRLRGTIRVTPSVPPEQRFVLDAAGRHRWRPLAPCARAQVEFDAPNTQWTGTAYVDCNAGDEPLESAFSRWDWSRAALADGSTVLFYDAERRDGTRLALALRAHPDGTIDSISAPPSVALPPSLWRVAGTTRSPPSAPLRLQAMLEDTPFYARSMITSEFAGEPTLIVHERLSLDRFGTRWVQALLPFRMPRRA